MNTYHLSSAPALHATISTSNAALSTLLSIVFRVHISNRWYAWPIPCSTASITSYCQVLTKTLSDQSVLEHSSTSVSYTHQETWYTGKAPLQKFVQGTRLFSIQAPTHRREQIMVLERCLHWHKDKREYNSESCRGTAWVRDGQHQMIREIFMQIVRYFALYRASWRKLQRCIWPLAAVDLKEVKRSCHVSHDGS